MQPVDAAMFAFLFAMVHGVYAIATGSLLIGGIGLLFVFAGFYIMYR
jgi:hypothetical protein